MRLICPKCEAQYNVADDAIPTGGRDVQCSSCAHTWFQSKKKSPVSREVSRILSTPLPSVRKAQSRDASAFDEPQSGKANVGGPKHETAENGPRRRAVDPAVADILRKEAARAQSVTDYSADHAPAPKETNSAATEETRKRIAAVTAEDDNPEPGSAAAAVAAAKANPRAIPDMSEINHALRARAEAMGEGGLSELERLEADRRRGFRRGFMVVLIMIGLFLAPYIYSNELVAYMPELKGYVATYVAVIDQFRLTMDTLVNAAVAVFKSLTA